MPPLASDLRKQLENVCIAARDAAEAAACSALKKRAVDQAKPFAHFNDEDKRLRRWLRARGKQAGDVEGPDKTQTIDHLTQELAYEYWHRMLFARFLAENHLLMHPDGVAVSLEECEELAPSERAPNGYVLAARYASRMLPQIFRIDDVLLDIEFAPEQRLALERLLASLPRETFLADDSLGWVYQFWQTKRKDEVNKSGDKIDGRTLPAVTQLFTEDYMVQFLLHNTIGAWWCGRHGITGPAGGAGVPAGKSPVPLDYLRWAPGLAVAPVAQPPSAGATGEGAQPGAAVPQSKEPTGSRDGDVAQPLPAGATGEGAQPGAAVPQSKEPTGSRDGDVAQPPSAGATLAGSRDGDVAQPPSAGATLAKPVRAEYRRNLPHLQAEGKTYYVTFCTHQRWTLPEEVRPMVVKHCLHDEGLKLRMHALVVMPDHVHLIFTPMTDPQGKPYGLSEILGGIKGASAHTINKHLKRRGPVWQDESFDHILRREEKLEEKVEYVRQNPVRKGLVKAPEEYPYTWVEWRDLPAEGAQPRAAVPHARIEEAGEEPGAAVVPSSLVAQPPAKGAQPRAAVPHARIEEAGEEPGAAVVPSSLVAQPPPAVALADPAAGTFDGWPKSLKEFTMLDPCCGSGHFLTAAFRLLVPLRMHDEGLSPVDACDAVFRENLFGLEIDPRCTQIAAFALALTAWTYPGPDGQPMGYRPLPNLNIACSGQGVVGSKDDWHRLAIGDANFKIAMDWLYDLFQKAPTLGSLINPTNVADALFGLGIDTLRGKLNLATTKFDGAENPDRLALGVAASGIALAATLMAREFTLVATNVPYLARGKQDKVLREYIAEVHPAARPDLATTFVERCLDYCMEGGTTALVTPQNWLFLSSYKSLREDLLKRRKWDLVVRLGPRAFETIGGEVVSVAMTIITTITPDEPATMAGLDVANATTPAEKAAHLAGGGSARLETIRQAAQLSNPDSRIGFSSVDTDQLLSSVSHSSHGIGTFDSPRFCRNWWEVQRDPEIWVFQQSTPERTSMFAGCCYAVRWENGRGSLARLMADKEAGGYTSGKWRAGVNEWGKKGVLVGQMNDMPCTIYLGHAFDENASVIIPAQEELLASLWCFCSSDSFVNSIRAIDDSIKVTCGSLVKIPFDLSLWQQTAAERYPDGLPEPHSDDPTQWLFQGHPKGSTDSLQVAVARLNGYRWPDQEPDELDGLADADGIVPNPSVRQ